MYSYLTGENSAAPSAMSRAVRARLKEAIQSQDPDFVIDLRHDNDARPMSYAAFYAAAEVYNERHALVAVDDRRHGQMCHLALALSVRDFREQVSATLPPKTPVPSVETLRRQFLPPNPFSAVASQYTGRLNVRFMVQSTQVHHEHQDVHYAVAIFRYLRDLLAILLRDVYVP